MTGQEKHSEIGASSAHRWMNCPGSVQLSRQFSFPQKTSSYAEEGKEAHTVAEKLLKGELTKDIRETLDPEMLDAVKIYADVISNDLLTISNLEKQLQLESRVKLNVSPNAFGTCDAWFYGDDTLFIYDFKYGKGVKVDAMGNEQLKYYALGVCETFKLKPKNVVLTIIQPRLNNTCRTILSYMYLTVFAGRLEKAIHNTQKKHPDYKAGKHCQFCPALAICGTAKQKIENDFKDLPMPNEIKDGKEIAAYMEKGEYLKSWLNAVKSYAENMIEMGMEVPGYALVEGQGNRAWRNENEVEKQFAAEYKDRIYNYKLKSPAQLEKIVGKQAILDYVVRPSTGKKLVKTDNAPASISDFKPFTQKEDEI